jgi:hypothetical protein
LRLKTTKTATAAATAAAPAKKRIAAGVSDGIADVVADECPGGGRGDHADDAQVAGRTHRDRSEPQRGIPRKRHPEALHADEREDDRVAVLGDQPV